MSESGSGPRWMSTWDQPTAYERWYASSLGRCYGASMEAVLSPWLSATEASRVLDVGCGPGLAIERLFTRDAEVWGLDCSLEMEQIEAAAAEVPAVTDQASSVRGVELQRIDVVEDKSFVFVTGSEESVKRQFEWNVVAGIALAILLCIASPVRAQEQAEEAPVAQTVEGGEATEQNPLVVEADALVASLLERRDAFQKLEAALATAQGEDALVIENEIAK